jgi:hypothetical protein
MAKALKWFGVKVFLRTDAVGRARRVDPDYDPNRTLLEERVVSVRARDGKDAFGRVRARIAEDAVEYENAYGQRVRQRLLPGWEAYELSSSPGDGTEVFSSMRSVATPAKDTALLGARPEQMTAAIQKRRKRFIAAELAEGLDAIWNRRRPTGR